MSIRIGLGAAGVPFSGPAALGAWVDLCEAGAADSIWFSDRLVSTAPTLEPMVAMAFLAGRTERLKFGMNAIVLPFRDPLVLAKECATLDHLSGGRLLPAFGVGQELAVEFAATGRSAEGRGTLSDEMLGIMTRLWAGEQVTCHGKYFQYRDATIAPLPLQKPLPVWIGGSSEAAVRRTARLGTGWLAGLEPPVRLAPIVARIKEATAKAGRTIDDDHYGAGFPFRFGSWDEPEVQRAAAGMTRLAAGFEPKAYLAVGGADAIAGRVQEYVAAGISKFVLRPIASSDAEIMDQTQRLLEEVLPRVHT
ncbi:MAG: TIGR03619 family F420-dependent LLM class oxidoreductase [Gemmataceae bacterium]|nr:TIGR03619 family F420-dependent LLM class oxidoreductase [Gemmataceae bacterium]